MSFFIKIFSILLVIAIVIMAIFYYIKIPKNNLLPKDNYHKETEILLKDKIGQMIMLGFRGVQVDENSYITNTIRDIKIGGVILFDYDIPSKSFPRNIISPEQTKKLISDLQSYSTTPLLVSVDAEGGNVNRLKEIYGFLNILSAKEMGQDKTLETTEKESIELAKELKELGFNMNFAPVVDIDTNPQNPIIGALGRSFSSDPKRVAGNARVFIENHLENNIISVVKHYPGHGSSTSDSHLGIVDITNTYQKEELNPYIELNKEGLLDVVMTAHIINRSIDKEYPATLSPDFLQRILREEIGFEGVIISDDIQMNAIVDNYGFREAIIKAVNAGCYILLLSNNGTTEYDEQLPYKAINIIYDAIKEGKISKERVEESYHRIYNLKKKFGVIN